MRHLSSNILFVISAYKGNNAMADMTYHEELKSVLQDRKDTFIEGEGRWEGKEEANFIVSSPAGVGHKIVKSVLLELADVFNQHSILEVDSTNSGLYLHTLDGKEEYLGKFRLSSEEPTGDYTKLNEMYISLTN